jgi:hypothetical protein
MRGSPHSRRIAKSRPGFHCPDGQKFPEMQVWYFYFYSELLTAISHVQRQRPARFNWYFAYGTLVTFEVVVLLSGIAFNHHLLSRFSAATATNRARDRKMEELLRLGGLASNVNAPCNDVFQSKDPDHQAIRLSKSVIDFDAHANSLREKLGTLELYESERTRLDFGLVEALDAVLAMADEGRMIFNYCVAHDLDNASQRMAVADQENYLLNKIFSELRTPAFNIVDMRLVKQQGTCLPG